MPKYARHGHSESPEYVAWHSMKSRCYDPSHPGWIWYGYLGVTVCPQWKDDFIQFLKDVGDRPSPDYVLSRKSKKLPFQPDNTSWVKREESYRRRSNNRFFRINGSHLCMADWARKSGINKSTLHYRLARGLSMKRSIAIGHGRRGKFLSKR